MKTLTLRYLTLDPQKGFTLIELLVSASIMGIIGLVILTTFGSGFHVFERVQAFGGPQADVLLALEEMEKEIKNLFPYSAISFTGDAGRIAFPAVIEVADEDDDEALVTTIGRISYYLGDDTSLENTGKVLMRGQQDYSEASNNGPFDNDNSEALAPVESLAFQFYVYDEEAETYSWQSSWGEEEKSLLSGVKITVTYKDGEQDVTVERSAFIPSIQKIFEIKADEKGSEGDDDEDDGGGGESVEGGGDEG